MKGWHICTICFRAFQEARQLISHNKVEHQIHQETLLEVDLFLDSSKLCPIVKLERCDLDLIRDTENAFDQDEEPVIKIEGWSLYIGDQFAQGDRQNVTESEAGFEEEPESPETNFKGEGRGPLKCEICGFVSRSLNPHQLELHMRNHSSSKPYKCTICKREFGRDTSYRRHTKYIHPGGAAPVHKSTPSVKDKEKKKKRHHECQECGKVYTQSTSLRRHNLIEHNSGGGAAQPKLECPHCGSQFKNKDSLRCHIASLHSGPPKHKCQVCGKAFRFPYNLKVHLLWHENATVVPPKRGFTTPSFVRGACENVSGFKSTVQCDYCGKRYPDQGKLDRHVGFHKRKEREAAAAAKIRLHCEICKKKFSQRNKLAYHEARAHKELVQGLTSEKVDELMEIVSNDDFECKACGRVLCDRSALKRHYLIHTGEKRYRCTLCGSNFTTNSALQIHIIRRHNETTNGFDCDICNKRFYIKGDLQKHKEKIHSRDQ